MTLELTEDEVRVLKYALSETSSKALVQKGFSEWDGYEKLKGTPLHSLIVKVYEQK